MKKWKKVMIEGIKKGVKRGIRNAFFGACIGACIAFMVTLVDVQPVASCTPLMMQMVQGHYEA